MDTDQFVAVMLIVTSIFALIVGYWALMDEEKDN